MKMDESKYLENGVSISKTQIKTGDEIVLYYDGLLAKSGADRVYAHIGYGDTWEEKEFVPMSRVDGVFAVQYKVLLPGDMNISFKDSAENWDNNSQMNYTFPVAKKANRSVKVAGAKSETEVKTTEKRKTAAKTKTAAKAAENEKTVAEKKKGTRKKKES